MSQTTNKRSASGFPLAPPPFELKIGITGHRELPDESAAVEAVHRLLDHIESTLKQSAEYPRSVTTARRGFWDWFDRCLLVVVKLFWWSMPLNPPHVELDRRVPLCFRFISALASGADQIIAKATARHADAKLDAALPFNEDVYEQDFTSPDEREQLRLLVRQAESAWIALPDAGPALSESDRARGYRLAGERIVQQSDILIAVWDGEPSRGEGGTADVVAQAVVSHVPVYWIRSTAPHEPAVLLTAGDDASRVASGIPATAKDIAPLFHQVCAYYRDPAFQEDRFTKILERESGRLLRAANESGMDLSAIERAKSRRLPQHVYADHLAMRHQRLHLRSATAIICFAAAAVTSAALHLLVFKHAYWLILVEIACMLASAVLLRVSQRERWHEKWLYDRYLAERLRSLFFLDLMVVAGESSPVPQPVMPFYDRPAAWVDVVLDIPPAQDWFAEAAPRVEPLRRFISKAWLASQADWHKRTATRRDRAAHRLHLITYALFATTLLCALLHYLHVGEHDTMLPMDGFPYVLKVLAVSLPAWGGALHAMGHLYDNGRIAQRNRRMHVELAKLDWSLGETQSLEQLREIVERADQLMAAENLDWMMTLRHHKPELHV